MIDQQPFLDVLHAFALGVRMAEDIELTYEELDGEHRLSVCVEEYDYGWSEWRSRFYELITYVSLSDGGMVKLSYDNAGSLKCTTPESLQEYLALYYEVIIEEAHFYMD